MNRSTKRATVALMALGIGMAGATPAIASGNDVIKNGSCSDSTSWKLKAKPDDGRLEVEGEVDSNVNGQSWNWKILHNGNVSAHGSARTHAPSGSFSVERRVTNAAGTDVIGWRATNPRTGETCRGTLRI